MVTARPRITVATIAERDGRFLFVEERGADGNLVINQPAGHLEPGETLPQAAVRECLEETAWHFRPEYLVGIYLWSAPSLQRGYLRVCFAGSVDGHEAGRRLDEGIERMLWLSRDEIGAQPERLRSPLVLQCVDDYLAGERYPLSLLKSLIQTHP